ncbi:MAG: gliding motility protein GldC [Ignavibacteriaceae bacterium]|nr:gliding motility protein GldC [Ignavibacteriaceae bacterium]
MSKTSEIKFTIQLDDKNMPKKIEWEATDGGFEGKKVCSTMMISLWDKKEQITMGIDLWTKEMLVNDMNIHFSQILNKMSGTYLRATGNNEIAEMIQNFSSEFAARLDLIKNIK